MTMKNSEHLAGPMADHRTPLVQAMRREFIALERHIRKTSEEVRALAPLSLTQRRLPAASAELDAALREMEDATGSIMASAERILGCAGSEPHNARFSEQALLILEACAFHDLVGQRLTKISSLLSLIERRIGRLASELGVTDDGADTTEEEIRSEALMLHGPAIGGPEVSQADIDALFD